MNSNSNSRANSNPDAPLSPTVELAKSLIQCPSITPLDAGCQDLIAERLQRIGFTIQSLPFENVQNLWAVYGSASPLFVFAGHSDVVPPGNLAAWNSDPFTPVVKNGFLVGRGACDMKGSIAAMVTAIERFLSLHPNPNCSLALLITSDEEGPAHHGTRKVIEHLAQQNIKLDYCIVGEPSSHEILGDTIKIGRRGSMSGTLTVHGIQGHIAYPDKAQNPIHHILQPLKELTEKVWDSEKHLHFPPTSFQISNINAGTGAHNVIPGLVECLFNLRFSPLQTPLQLQSDIQHVLDAYGLQYTLEWEIGATPFITTPGVLSKTCQDVIHTLYQRTPELSTSGGTSDARFLAPHALEIVELGPCNTTAHQANERVGVEELDQLSHLYEQVLLRLFT